MLETIIDQLKERRTGNILYPETSLEAVRESAGEGSRNLREILSHNGIPLDYELYGYRVNLADSNPQTRISYLAMAQGKRPAFWNYANGYFDAGDWANAFFLRKLFPCTVKDSGETDYRLDPDNYLLREDGTPSDITSTAYEGSAMSAFPTIWTKRWQDEHYLYCLICDRQLDEDYHAYMHTRKDGSVAAWKYIGMYLPILYNERYKSLSGVNVTVNQTFEKELLYTHNIGENWEVFSISDWAVLGDLLTLISRSDNFQTSFGYGLVNASALSAASDGGNLRCGGAFFNNAALNTNSWQKVFHLHNLYSNHMTRMGGIVYKTGVLYVKPFPPYNITGEGYEDTGLTITGTSDTYCKLSVMNDYGRFPSVLGGSATTYECDAAVYSNTVTAIGCTRGIFNGTTKSGKLGLHLNQTVAAHANIAPRITCFSAD